MFVMAGTVEVATILTYPAASLVCIFAKENFRTERIADLWWKTTKIEEIRLNFN